MIIPSEKELSSFTCKQGSLLQFGAILRLKDHPALGAFLQRMLVDIGAQLIKELAAIEGLGTLGYHIQKLRI